MVEPFIYLNGLFWPLSKANVSVQDRGFSYGDGLFETLRAYSKQVYRLEEHLDRLMNSAKLLFIELPITRNELRSAIYRTLEINGLSDSIIRLTVTRGEQEPGINIDYDAPPTVVIQTRAVVSPPTTAYSEGVAISIFRNCAPRVSGIFSQIKSCNFLSQIVLRERALKDGSFEGVMLDHNNYVTEGTTANIFIVKNNILKTPQLNEYILPGVTRQVILDIASIHGIDCKEQLISEKDLFEADEVFLANTGIEILPVCQANRLPIGTGKPGPMTERLHQLFRKSF